MGVDCISMFHDYVGTSGHGSVFNQRIRDRICDLSKALAETETAVEFQGYMTQFYKEFGVGKLGLHKAFRIRTYRRRGIDRADHEDRTRTFG